MQREHKGSINDGILLAIMPTAAISLEQAKAVYGKISFRFLASAMLTASK